MNNPADDLIRDKTLEAIKEPNHWSQGPPFLLQSPDAWPEQPSIRNIEDEQELWKTVSCGLTVSSLVASSTDDKEYSTWQELMDATTEVLHPFIVQSYMS